MRTNIPLADRVPREIRAIQDLLLVARAAFDGLSRDRTAMECAA